MLAFEREFVQAIADSFRLASVILLICYILYNSSCKGISGKTQFLFLVLYVIRSIDLLSSQYANTTYLATMKMIFILLGLLVMILFGVYWKSYNYKKDSFWMEGLLLLALILAGLYHWDMSMVEIGWSFSKFLDSVAIIPQIYMYIKTGESKNFLALYTLCLVIYKGLYVFVWLYFNSRTAYYLKVAGYVQFSTYVLFLFLIPKGAKKTSEDVSDKHPNFRTLHKVILHQFPFPSQKPIGPSPIFTVLPPDTPAYQSSENKSHKYTLLENKY